MEEAQFRDAADGALNALFDRLAAAGERYPLEADMSGGALVVEFEEASAGGAAKFVVSPNAPVRQIWVSANLTSYKLDWDAGRGEFVLGATGQTLTELMAGAMGRHLGQAVEL